MKDWLRAALGEPLVHFLLAGFLLFVFFAVKGTSVDPASRTITVTEADVTRLAASWEQTWQRPPTPAELDGLIRDHIREEVYYREGLRLSLDKDDAIVRRRIRSKMEFLQQSEIDAAAPAEAQLQEWLNRHADRYAEGTRLSFDQVYVAPAKGANDAARASHILAELRGGADWRRLGDAISLPSSLDREAAARIAADFGQQFANGLAPIPASQWAGPVESSFGLHLVRVRERLAGRSPPLAAVRQRVENDWRAANRAAQEAKAYQVLLDAYTVRIEKP